VPQFFGCRFDVPPRAYIALPDATLAYTPMARLRLLG
jgi:hypothetical protein